MKLPRIYRQIRVAGRTFFVTYVTCFTVSRVHCVSPSPESLIRFASEHLVLFSMYASGCFMRAQLPGSGCSCVCGLRCAGLTSHADLHQAAANWNLHMAVRSINHMPRLAAASCRQWQTSATGRPSAARCQTRCASQPEDQEPLPDRLENLPVAKSSEELREQSSNAEALIRSLESKPAIELSK